MVGFCSCSDDSALGLYNKWEKELVNDDISEGFKDLLKIIEKDNGNNLKKVHDVGRDGLTLIEWCVDFLLYKNKFEDEIDEISVKSNHEELGLKNGIYTSPKKYITLYSFIYDFLKIPNGSGYEYWLMNILDWYNISEHGSAIRCSWFNDSVENPYHKHVLTVARKDKIKEWIKNAPDNI